MAFLLLTMHMQTLNYVIASIILFLMSTLIFILWFSPLKMKFKLERNGFSGPSPQFPFGNLLQMRSKRHTTYDHPSSGVTHDIHAAVFPYFARWRKSFGNLIWKFTLTRYNYRIYSLQVLFSLFFCLFLHKILWLIYKISGYLPE